MGQRVEFDIDEATFAVLARRSGVPLNEGQTATLLEGYRLFAKLVADLERPTDAKVEPALIFVPEPSSPCV